MEVTIDLEKVGMIIGYVGTKFGAYSFGGSLLFQVAKTTVDKTTVVGGMVDKVAKAHKIDSSSASAVADNLFESLWYTDY